MDERDQIIEALKAEILLLKQKISELEHRLNLNSKNSGKPPSSDGLGKENAIPKSQIKRRAKNKAARKSRKNQNNLEQVDNPDIIIDHNPEICISCESDLKSIASDKYKRNQVFDLPKPRFEVTEHRIHRKICPCCQKKNYGIAPDYAKAHTSYGPNFGAFCIYLNTRQMIPYNRIAELSKDLFGRSISEQVIINFIKDFGEVCNDGIEIIEANLRKGQVKHADETGLRVEGSLHWMFVTSSNLWALYSVSKKRGDVLQNLDGILSRDCFAPYDKYNPEARMALCNAHLLRDLESIKFLPNNRWTGRMQQILHIMNGIKQDYLDLGQEIPENKRNRAIKIYDDIIFKQSKIYDLTEKIPKKLSKIEQKSCAIFRRMRDRKEDILRFLNEKDAPFTNNLAETDLRMNKVRQKVSGCFRKIEYAEIFAKIRSVIVTIRKQGATVLDIISEAIKSRSIPFPALA